MALEHRENTMNTTAHEEKMLASLGASRFWAWIGVAAMAQFVLAAALVHLVVGPQLPAHMSQYANTEGGFLWLVAAFSFAAGAGALTWALQPLLRGAAWTTRAGLSLLWAAVLGAVLLAAFPVGGDEGLRATVGDIHNRVALPTFLMGSLAVVLLIPELKRLPGLGDLAKASVVVGIAALALAPIYWITNMGHWEWVGLVQRSFVAFLAFWFVAIGLSIVNYPAWILQRRQAKSRRRLRAPRLQQPRGP